jgi:hypothetical protein
MRKVARLIGLIWMAVVAVLATWLLVNNSARFSSFHLLIPVLFFCAAPGAILFSWGRGPYFRSRTVAEALRPRAPYDRAEEAGHVMHIETDSHA